MERAVLFSNDNGLIAKWQATIGGHYALRSYAQFDPLFVHTAERPDVLAILDGALVDREPTILNVIKDIPCRFLLCADEWPEDKQVMALVSGIAGYCDYHDDPLLLSRAAQSVIRGEIWIKRHLIPQVIGTLIKLKQPSVTPQPVPAPLSSIIPDAWACLSEREREVARMVQHGESNKSIAAVLNISERTVKAHLTSIYKKLNIPDRLHLVVRSQDTPP